jgi:hypothetical protein
MEELKEKDMQVIDGYIYFDIENGRGGYYEISVKIATLKTLLERSENNGNVKLQGNK